MAKERRGAMLSTGQLVGSLVGPLIGGVLADLTGSYRIPFYCTSATIRLSMGSCGSPCRSASSPRPRCAAGARSSVA